MTSAVMTMSATTPFCELSELRTGMRDSAKRSLRFLAQRVMGLRLSDERLAELERGSLPKDNHEARAVSIWQQLRSNSCEPHGMSDLERFLLSE